MNHRDVRNINVDLDYDEYAGRDGKWGNPYEYRGVCDRDSGETRTFYRFNLEDKVELIDVKSRRDAIVSYSKYLVDNIELFESSIKDLEGKTLGCHCNPVMCHASVVLYLRDLILGREFRVYELGDLGAIAEGLRSKMKGYYIVVAGVDDLDTYRALGEHVCGDDLVPILIPRVGYWSRFSPGVYLDV